MTDMSLPQTAEAVLHHARHSSFATVSGNVRSATRQELQELIGALDDAKATVVALGDEGSANELLAMSLAAQGAIDELGVWTALESGLPDAAWDSLVSAQYAASAAMRAHPGGAKYERDLNRRMAMQALLFPPQAFMSSGMIVRQAECSICGSDYDECEHVKGLAYMGEMCIRTIQDAQLLEASIVDEPSDKRCRVTNVDGIDTLTLAPTEGSSDAG